MESLFQIGESLEGWGALLFALSHECVDDDRVDDGPAGGTMSISPVDSSSWRVPSRRW